jgi:hypothetical protein
VPLDYECKLAGPTRVGLRYIRLSQEVTEQLDDALALALEPREFVGDVHAVHFETPFIFGVAELNLPSALVLVVRLTYPMFDRVGGGL